jgi:hypothetical protein
MKIKLADPSLLADLLAFLRKEGCSGASACHQTGSLTY